MTATRARGLRLSCLGAGAAFCVGLSACVASNGDFAKAKSIGTAAAYSEFIARNPRSSMKGQAEKARDAALWKEAEGAGSAAGYLAFLKKAAVKNPKAAEAKARCGKLLAEGKGQEGDYLDYLSRYRDDPSAPAIRKALGQARYGAVQDEHSPEGYLLYAAQYPGTPEAAKLSAALRRRDFEEAQKLDTRLAYAFFLKRYPAAPEAAKARSRMERFGEPLVEAGGAMDLARLLPRLRQASTRLTRLECRKALAAEIAAQADLFGAAAEDLRGQLRLLAADQGSLPAACFKRAMAVPTRNRQAAANAVHGLARLMERQQELAASFSGADKVKANAREIGERAAGLAEASEMQELELEALYGNMPADPRRPEDTASKNAREAERRAKRAWELARGADAGRDRQEAGEVLRLMDRQADLLIEVIADLEEPAS